jgi:winged helix DNA-binding protein
LDIARRRLANQHLTTPTLETPADVVRTLGAVQAQDYAGAKWAISMRTRGRLSDAAIEQAMADGAILRTHVLRPTWHFVAPGDIRWMLALTGPRVKAAMASYDRKLGLTDAVYRRSNDTIARALEGGTHLTRTELAAVLRKRRVNVEGTQRLSHLMFRAELDALICSGPRRGKQFTYALLDERAPAAPAKTRDEALLELTRRYFATRGPATPHDFAWWSGLTVGDANAGIALAGAALARATIGDRTYWFDPAAPPVPRASRAPVAYLLPNYDEYFIGFRDRSAIGERLRSIELVTGGDALIAHVIVIGGQLVGGWRRTFEKDAVAIELNVLGRLSAAERKAVDAAISAYGTFLGVRTKVL